MDVTKRQAGQTKRARSLRADDTEPEYRMWGELRARRLNGFKFARQIPIGPYIVDFLCREQHLVLELDGGQHSESAHDERRTRFLLAHGYSVLRFWNDEVLRERRAVLDTILAALDGVLPPSPGLRYAKPTLSPAGRGGRQPPRLERKMWSVADSGETPLPSGERVAEPAQSKGGGRVRGNDEARGYA